MPISLRIRHLKSREVGVVTFEAEADALVWLAARPPFVDVMGLAGQTSVSMEVQAKLRAKMRPLDDEEKTAEKELQAALDKEEADREKEAQKKEAEMAEQHKAAMLTADPNRVMEIRWTYDHGMKLTDAADPREITEAARDALLAWIAERNEWVAGRGQIVGEATAKVWPGKLPEKEQDRVKEGRFFPVTAPEQKPN